MDTQSWQREINEAIDNILSEKPSEQKIIPLAALFSLQERFGKSELAARRDFVPQSNIDELLQDMLQSFISYSDFKAEYQHVHSETAKSDLLKELESFLDLERQIFNMLWRGADTPEEREKLKAFSKRICAEH